MLNKSNHPAPVARQRSRHIAGFTLIETLVALAVVGIALAAAIKATNSSIEVAARLKYRTAAIWVASNVVNRMLALHEFPDLGAREGKETQGVTEFTWRMEVSVTPNYSFRRVEVKVFLPDDNDYAVAKQVSYVAKR
jgi:general secretion pathway protein I